VTTSEDLKDVKRYQKRLKYALIVGSIGILMEVLQWNYLCHFQCILFMFAPFLTLITIKGVASFFKKMFTIEPYQIDRGELSDGFWKKNKGDLKYKNYYTLYSIVIFILPFFIMITLYRILKENMC
jgi:hypothetical protein